MRSPTQREWTLLGLLAVVGLAMLWVRSGQLGAGRASTGDAGERELGQAPHVHLDELSLPPEDYDPQGRNLFAYGPPPGTPRQAPVQTVTPPPPEPPPVRPVRQQVATPPPPRASGPTPPKPTFKYLGYLGPKTNRIAVFEPQDKETGMLLAGAGDVLEREFRLVEFKYETVVIGYTDPRFADQTTELAIQGKDK